MTIIPRSKFQCLSYTCRDFVSIIRVRLDGGSIFHCPQSIEPSGWVV
jgi:hypothetical protein